MEACRGGHIETANVLLDHGANVDYHTKVHLFHCAFDKINISLIDTVPQAWGISSLACIFYW